MWCAPAGSHTSVVLVEAGAKVTIVDDLSNSFLEVLERLKMVLKDKFSNISFEQVRTPGCDDLCDACMLLAPVT
jgi:UDP-glucose 4-epimerase